MRRLSILVTLPFALAIIVFAVSNRATVTIDLWPLPWSATLPLFLPLLGGILLGVLAGAGAMVIGRARWRHRATRAEKRSAALERELAKRAEWHAPDQPAAAPSTRAFAARAVSAG
ncbi:MAG: DUF1049 domain-containing protein [Alphaproteobacteria bacterium]|nr:DUF1049 domain-containing protein [Alphaproteobacteria bacterium]